MGALENLRLFQLVMPGFMPGIHVFFPIQTLMARTSPAMTLMRTLCVQEVTDIHRRSHYISLPGTSGLFALERTKDMTGTTRSSEGLDDRRKRLLYRCWHRGTREMDLILGRFADAHLADLTDAELTELEALIELPDPDLYAALTGAGAIPPEMARGLFERMKSFRAWEAGA